MRLLTKTSLILFLSFSIPAAAQQLNTRYYEQWPETQTLEDSDPHDSAGCHIDSSQLRFGPWGATMDKGHAFTAGETMNIPRDAWGGAIGWGTLGRIVEIEGHEFKDVRYKGTALTTPAPGASYGTLEDQFCSHVISFVSSAPTRYPLDNSVTALIDRLSEKWGEPDPGEGSEIAFWQRYYTAPIKSRFPSENIPVATIWERLSVENVMSIEEGTGIFVRLSMISRFNPSLDYREEWDSKKQQVREEIREKEAQLARAEAERLESERQASAMAAGMTIRESTTEVRNGWSLSKWDASLSDEELIDRNNCWMEFQPLGLDIMDYQEWVQVTVKSKSKSEKNDTGVVVVYSCSIPTSMLSAERLVADEPRLKEEAAQREAAQMERDEVLAGGMFVTEVEKVQSRGWSVADSAPTKDDDYLLRTNPCMKEFTSRKYGAKRPTYYKWGRAEIVKKEQGSNRETDLAVTFRCSIPNSVITVN